MSAKKVFQEAPEEYVLPGNSACQGCGSTLALRWVLKALGKKTVIVNPASCGCVYVGLYPRTAISVPYIQVAFAAGPAAASGIVGGLEARGEKDVTVICWAGDGGTADIGVSSLSGSAERNTNYIYFCYDNEAYMNTGTQRSGSTPAGAWTTTTPMGKKEGKKDMALIMAAHRIPYVATSCSSYPLDLYDKTKKAKIIKGTRYIHILTPCPPGWRFDTELTVKIGRLAVQSGMWLLYEIENGVFHLSAPSRKILENPEKRVSVRDYIKAQGRFRVVREDEIKRLQETIDEKLEKVAELDGKPLFF
ncbi:MAG: 3-methyl-2-oxobutanoate dehydrogenase subunit beta [Candidatus Freyarchaeota archaeon]|nr:3-methyl-2-oxobutanoate dehydrogenase subunit beta [Candidatus Jordarchaeia archaeon]